jgi:hypothetical protein
VSQLSVKELIDQLAEHPQDATIMVDLGNGELRYPDDLSSYRGYYEQLAIEYRSGLGRHEKPPTVDDFTTALRGKVFDTVQGYKGGTYTIQNNTPVWVSQWGECSDSAVSSVERRDDAVVVLTEQVPW